MRRALFFLPLVFAVLFLGFFSPGSVLAQYSTHTPYPTFTPTPFTGGWPTPDLRPFCTPVPVSTSTLAWPTVVIPTADLSTATPDAGGTAYPTSTPVTLTPSPSATILPGPTPWGLTAILKPDNYGTVISRLIDCQINDAVLGSYNIAVSGDVVLNLPASGSCYVNHVSGTSYWSISWTGLQLQSLPTSYFPPGTCASMDTDGVWFNWTAGIQPYTQYGETCYAGVPYIANAHYFKVDSPMNVSRSVYGSIDFEIGDPIVPTPTPTPIVDTCQVPTEQLPIINPIITPGSCYTIIPSISLDLPDYELLPDSIGVPGLEVCTSYIVISGSVFGISIEWLISAVVGTFALAILWSQFNR